MEKIHEPLKLKYVGKDGDMDVYKIGCHSLTGYELSLLLDYCRNNNCYMLLDLNNKRILIKKN